MAGFDGRSARNNVITGFAYEQPTSVFDLTNENNQGLGAWASVDYNCFYNPDITVLGRYTDPSTGKDFVGFGTHDCGDSSVSADPKFAQPRIVPLPFGDREIWARTVTVSQMLAFYRAMYTPASGSPLIDRGNPADDTSQSRPRFDARASMRVCLLSSACDCVGTQVPENQESYRESR